MFYLFILQKWKQINCLLPDKMCFNDDEFHTLLIALPNVFWHLFLPPIPKEEVWYNQQPKRKQQLQFLTECPLFLSTVFKPLFSQEEQFYQVLGKAEEYELLSSEVSDLSGEKQQGWDFY